MFRPRMAGWVTVNVAQIPKLPAADRLAAAPTNAAAKVNHVELEAPPFGLVRRPIHTERVPLADHGNPCKVTPGHSPGHKRTPAPSSDHPATLLRIVPLEGEKPFARGVRRPGPEKHALPTPNRVIVRTPIAPSRSTVCARVPMDHMATARRQNPARPHGDVGGMRPTATGDQTGADDEHGQADEALHPTVIRHRRCERHIAAIR